MTSTPERQGWQLPPDYYERIGQSEPSAFFHLAGRLLIAPYRFAKYGTPIIETSAGFDELIDEVSLGNAIVTPVHRSSDETVMHPAILEAVGLHHARPMSKIGNLQNPLVRWGMHKLGSYAVDKGNVNLKGLSEAEAKMLELKQHLIRYVEGTRVHENVLQVAELQNGVIYTAVANDSWIVPMATAGLSTEKTGKGSERRVIARDKRGYFGFGPKVVHVFGTPYKIEKPDFDITVEKSKVTDLAHFRRVRAFVNEQSAELRNILQTLLNRGYEIRGSALEERFDN